jgi:hypothetical protein
MKRILAVVAAAAAVLPALAQNTPFYIAGDFNGWNASGDLMTQISPGIWQATIPDVGGRHEFKVTEGDWNWSFPASSSGNSWFYGDANGNITITYDVNTYSDGWSAASGRIGVSVDPGTWTAVGDWEGWNNANPATQMTAIGGGIYDLSYAIATPGTYQYKAVDTGSWDAIGSDARCVNASTLSFTTLLPNQTVDFEVNALVGDIMVVVPEPTSLALGVFGLGLCYLQRRRL